MPKIVATKEDWIKLGYELFSEQGVSGIVVDKMSKKLTCNKSSFYWHFKTKKEFIEGLVDYWISKETEQIISLTNENKSGKEKLETLIAIVFKKDPYLDFIFYLKRYAKKENKIKKIIENIDNERILFVGNILMELGISNQDAIIKSNLFYKYLIGYHEMIRYKKQSENYFQEVKNEIDQFIKY